MGMTVSCIGQMDWEKQSPAEHRRARGCESVEVTQDWDRVYSSEKDSGVSAK